MILTLSQAKYCNWRSQLYHYKITNDCHNQKHHTPTPRKPLQMPQTLLDHPWTPTLKMALLPKLLAHIDHPQQFASRLWPSCAHVRQVKPLLPCTWGQHPSRGSSHAKLTHEYLDLLDKRPSLHRLGCHQQNKIDTDWHRLLLKPVKESQVKNIPIGGYSQVASLSRMEDPSFWHLALMQAWIFALM